MSTFLGKRPVAFILCSDSILLMRLKVGPTKGKKTADIESSLGVSSLSGGLRARRSFYLSHSDLTHYRGIPFLLVADGSSSVC